MNLPIDYVAWFCAQCGHEHLAKGPVSCYPVKCPKCGQEATQHGYPFLPTNNVSRRSDPYSNQAEVQVYFRAATGERADVTLNPEWVPDCEDDPVRVAHKVLAILKEKFLWSSRMKHIADILAAMEKCDKVSEINGRKNRVHELRKAIVLAACEYRDLMEEEGEAHDQK